MTGFGRSRRAVRTAIAVGVSAYDAQYLALAARTRQALVTADRRLYERGTAAGFDLVWLGDLPTSIAS